jgi:transcriptional regulator with XRE-family HTH domain
VSRGGAAQRLRVGNRKFVLVPESEYRRWVKDTETPLRDAVDFAKAGIGRDLKRKREKAGLTQSQVAAKAGIRMETLSRLENGHGNPTVGTVRRILRALGERTSGRDGRDEFKPIREETLPTCRCGLARSEGRRRRRPPGA